MNAAFGMMVAIVSVELCGVPAARCFVRPMQGRAVADKALHVHSLAVATTHSFFAGLARAHVHNVSVPPVDDQTVVATVENPPDDLVVRQATLRALLLSEPESVLLLFDQVALLAGLRLALPDVTPASLEEDLNALGLNRALLTEEYGLLDDLDYELGPSFAAGRGGNALARSVQQAPSTIRKRKPFLIRRLRAYLLEGKLPPRAAIAKRAKAILQTVDLEVAIHDGDIRAGDIPLLKQVAAWTATGKAQGNSQPDPHQLQSVERILPRLETLARGETPRGRMRMQLQFEREREKIFAEVRKGKKPTDLAHEYGGSTRGMRERIRRTTLTEQSRRARFHIEAQMLEGEHDREAQILEALAQGGLALVLLATKNQWRSEEDALRSVNAVRLQVREQVDTYFDAHPIAALGRREAQVHALAKEGKSNEEIASELGIVHSTVTTLRDNAAKKLGRVGSPKP